jgi:hypothetical protein
LGEKLPTVNVHLSRVATATTSAVKVARPKSASPLEISGFKDVTVKEYGVVACIEYI